GDDIGRSSQPQSLTQPCDDDLASGVGYTDARGRGPVLHGCGERIALDWIKRQVEPDPPAKGTGPKACGKDIGIGFERTVTGRQRPYLRAFADEAGDSRLVVELHRAGRLI